jgi:hypothetical protein
MNKPNLVCLLVFISTVGIVLLAVPCATAQWIRSWERAGYSTIRESDIDRIMTLIGEHEVEVEDAEELRATIESIWAGHQQRFAEFIEQHREEYESIAARRAGDPEHIRRGCRFAEKQARVDDQTLEMIQIALMRHAPAVWREFERDRLWHFHGRTGGRASDARPNLHQVVALLNLHEHAHVDEETSDAIEALLAQYDLTMTDILRRMLTNERRIARNLGDHLLEVNRMNERALAAPTVEEGWQIHNEFWRAHRRRLNRLREPSYTASRQNLHYLELIALQLPDDLANDLRDRFRRMAYPAAFRPLPADSYLSCVEGLSLVDDEQAVQVDAVIACFHRELEATIDEFIRVSREQFAERYRLSRTTPQSSERRERVERLLEKREVLSERVISDLYHLLTEDQREVCPHDES